VARRSRRRTRGRGAGSPASAIDNAEMYLARWRTRAGRATRGSRRTASGARWRPMISLALYGGIRREEMFRLELEAMHYDNAYVVVRGARKNPEAEERVRIVPMTPSLHAALKAGSTSARSSRPATTARGSRCTASARAQADPVDEVQGAAARRSGAGSSFTGCATRSRPSASARAWTSRSSSSLLGHSTITADARLRGVRHPRRRAPRSAARSDGVFERALRREEVAA
jgi:integrase